MTTKQKINKETIPIIKEEVSIDKRWVDTAKVRIAKSVNERDVQLDISEEKDEVQIERVPIDQLVDTEPTVRHEGDTMIIPVVKEEIVIQKKLVLVEEIRITRKKNTETRRVNTTLREEEVNITREELNDQ